jgi:uncharacterized RDD family membrane protein YckC
MRTPSPTEDPYRSPEADLAPPLESAGIDNADRWSRLAAVLIDGAISMAVMFPLMYVSGVWDEALKAGRSSAFGVMPLGTTLLWAVIGLGLFVLIQGYPLHTKGQTWGKKALSIKVVDMQGGKPSFATLLFKRYMPTGVIANIPCVGTLYVLVDSLMIFRQDQRCLHDLIAGTRVVRTN